MKTLALLLFVTVPVAVLVYLSAGAQIDAAHPVEGRWTAPLAERRADPFPREFVHPSGERIAVPRPAQRIVSGTVFSDALLLRMCPPERVLALHQLSTDPRFSPVVAESAGFGRHHSGAAEEVLALEPDLVIVSSFSRRETRDLFSRQDCSVVRFDGFDSIADIQNNVRAFGYLLGLDGEAESVVEEMNERLERIEQGRQDRSAWRVLYYGAGRTAGAVTTFDSLLERVGARNAARDLGLVGSQAISPEQVLILDPDAIVLGVNPAEPGDARERLMQIPGFSSLRAVVDERLLPVPSGQLQSTSHHAVSAAEVMAEALDRWGKP